MRSEEAAGSLQSRDGLFETDGSKTPKALLRTAIGEYFDPAECIPEAFVEDFQATRLLRGRILREDRDASVSAHAARPPRY